MAPKFDTADRRIARLGTAAYGNATRDELLAAGISADQIRGWLEKGSLIPEYPGTYRIGHRAPSREASYMAPRRPGAAGCTSVAVRRAMRLGW